MTDNKIYLDDDLTMLRMDDGEAGPRINPRTLARSGDLSEDPLLRETHDPLANEPMPLRGNANYGRTGMARPLPPPERILRAEYTERAPREAKLIRKSSALVRWLFLTLGAVIIAGCAVLGTWYVVSRHQPSASVTDAKTVDEPVKNVFWQQADSAGAKTCAKAASEMGNVITQGATYALLSIFGKDNADGHALQMLAGQVYGQKDAQTVAASLLFAAPVNGQCEGAALRVVPVSQSCAQMGQSRAMQGALKPQDLSGVSVYEFPANGSRIMLIPSPNDTCTVISVIRSGD